MSDAPASRPHTWLPLAAAAAVALMVLAIAVAAFALGGGPDEEEAAVVAACEAEQATAGGPAIVAGEIYDPTQWRDHYAMVETHAQVRTPLTELSEQAVQEREARAAAYADSGEGMFAVVWRLEDESYLQCAAPLVDGAVDRERVSIGALDEQI